MYIYSVHCEKCAFCVFTLLSVLSVLLSAVGGMSEKNKAYIFTFFT